MRNDASLRTYTVSQLARLSGTSVRTLHHYDEIGLLKPASVGENGYRYYGREEMLRLQQILLHREFGLALGEIAALLDRVGHDRLQMLREQRTRIAEEADRYRRLARTIDRTIAELEGRDTVMDKQLYEGFSPEKQAGYEAWIIDKYGEQARERIEAGRTAMAAMSPEQKQDWMAEVAAIEGDLARAMAEGFAADDAALDPVMAAHHAWVGRTWKVPPTAGAYAELGVLYSTNPEFRARYEGIRPGLADWMAAAMRSYGVRVLQG
ncbi:MerR family transcriptional regulator [uncultured Brevundimonas sp.]|uniref:MerR family transcriptional regulator n=1 Tax=uncultured Brevundimonas sp. TaxID=213418 RepID=UPI0030ECE767|tara:strand:+ start:13822 stop:14616 length:795 start_codon:yes stop_codon:yes gene_type:complete